MMPFQHVEVPQDGGEGKETVANEKLEVGKWVGVLYRVVKGWSGGDGVRGREN